MKAFSLLLVHSPLELTMGKQNQAGIAHDKRSEEERQMIREQIDKYPRILYKHMQGLYVKYVESAFTRKREIVNPAPLQV